ncbi:reverse transcriptase family protein [Baia soyae]|uniref:RNA-directed DNA polymerase n=1 Tax=Baia soyae TaxID=1544746 RepID=A0A4R2RQD5_9BACL|nr:reverse transcriptase family protein [Baia soyae]TCP65318.1 RNA-directed DNA polymerase [Baia soyae]
MSNETNYEQHQPLTKEEFQARMKEMGKSQFIREEMLRLGFWTEETLTPEEQAERSQDLSELQIVQKELDELRSEARKLGDIKEQLKIARQKRIEESKRKRDEKKAQMEQASAEAQKQWTKYKKIHIPHVGNRYSIGLEHTGMDKEKLEAWRLPVLQTAKELACAMEIELNRLQWLTYHRDTATLCHYHRFSIPKKSGGTREISAPKPELRQAQQWVKEHILDLLPIHPTAYGFVKGKSTVDNARVHIQKRIVVKMDLQDFFPTITFWRVRGLFEWMGYSRQISTLLALLTTEPPHQQVKYDGKYYYIAIGERQLPQGACTSPAITNLITWGMDQQLHAWTEKMGYAYSRYADDLTFSSETLSSSQQVGVLLKRVRSTVKLHGFQVNEEKTRILRHTRRQRVTGIVVNEKPNLTRRRLRQFRALLHDVELHGLEAANRQNHPNLWAYINGYISYMAMVRPDLSHKYNEQASRISQKYGLSYVGIPV